MLARMQGRLARAERSKWADKDVSAQTQVWLLLFLFLYFMFSFYLHCFKFSNSHKNTTSNLCSNATIQNICMKCKVHFSIYLY
jgi:hypothetical protein